MTFEMQGYKFKSVLSVSFLRPSERVW